MDIKKIVLNNLNLKITSLFLAIVVWMLITGKGRVFSEKSFSVNVETINVSSNVDIRGLQPQRVKVKVRGASSVIKGLGNSDFKVAVDMSGRKQSGEFQYLTEDLLSLPEGVEVVSVFPRTVELTVERFVTVEVPVRVQYTGKLAKGVRLLSREVKPDKVRIFGLESQINRIRRLNGEKKIELGEITESMVVKIPIRKEKEILRFEDRNFVEVDIKVENRNGEQQDKQ